MTMKALAIIPAFDEMFPTISSMSQPVAGRPLIERAVEKAAAASHVERVVVLTNNADVAQRSEALGVRCLMQDDQPDDQHATETAVCRALHRLLDEEELPDLIVVLSPCTPLTDTADVNDTINLLLEKGVDCATAGAAFTGHVWQREGEDVHCIVQGHASCFQDSGGIAAMKTAGFLEHRQIYFGQIAVNALPAYKYLRIHSALDFEIVDMILRRTQDVDRVRLLPKKIDCVVFDFDGVFTDNGVILNQDGVESVRCDRMDGLGINLLENAGVPMLVLSKEPNPVVMARCKKLRLECLHGIDEKGPALTKWLEERGYALENTVYLGNDVNDEPCLKIVGCPVVVADAHPSVKPLAKFILEQPGGRGAVRALCDLIIEHLNN